MLEDGAPVDTILRVADEIDASLVVVGRQGSGKRPELLLGSTAHQIAEHSPRPVLVVPPIGRVSHPRVKTAGMNAEQPTEIGYGPFVTAPRP